MKYYKHRVTGRIIDQKTYDERISKWIKHYFVYIENGDTPDKEVKKDAELAELLA